MDLPAKTARKKSRPVRHRGVDSNAACCPMPAEMAVPLDAPAECRCPLTPCHPPHQCFTELCFDPYTRCYRVSDGRCPVTYSYRPTLRDCIPPGGVFCAKPCCSCKPAHPCSEQRSCEALWESVTDAQRALSRLLNAEAEKLDRIVASTDNLDILMEADQSTIRALVDIAFLEQALYHDLEKIHDICCLCEPAMEVHTLQSAAEAFNPLPPEM